jgi:ABC-2 type transport system permease protein
MNAIAIAELRMLLRNRLVAFCAIFIPLGLGVVLLLTIEPGTGGISLVASLQLVVMMGIGVYVTTTTTLAARRQTLFLKRLRSGAVSDVSIIGGLVGPIVLVSVVQVTIILAALGIAVQATPVHPWVLVLTVVALGAMFAGFALATAGVTNSPEHAQITTLPVVLITLGVPFWASLTGTEGLGVVKQWLPGGALPALMDLAWEGGDPLTVFPLLLPTLMWAAIAVVAARVMFRWEPRA